MAERLHKQTLRGMNCCPVCDFIFLIAMVSIHYSSALSSFLHYALLPYVLLFNS